MCGSLWGSAQASSPGTGVGRVKPQPSGRFCPEVAPVCAVPLSLCWYGADWQKAEEEGGISQEVFTEEEVPAAR